MFWHARPGCGYRARRVPCAGCRAPGAAPRVLRTGTRVALNGTVYYFFYSNSTPTTESRVPGRGRRVAGAGSRVPGPGSRVPGRACRTQSSPMLIRHESSQSIPRHGNEFFNSEMGNFGPFPGFPAVSKRPTGVEAIQRKIHASRQK